MDAYRLGVLVGGIFAGAIYSFIAAFLAGPQLRRMLRKSSIEISARRSYWMTGFANTAALTVCATFSEFDLISPSTVILLFWLMFVAYALVVWQALREPEIAGMSFSQACRLSGWPLLTFFLGSVVIFGLIAWGIISITGK